MKVHNLYCKILRRITKHCLTTKHRCFINLIILLFLCTKFSTAQPLSKIQKIKTAPGFAAKLEQKQNDIQLKVTLVLKSDSAFRNCTGNETFNIISSLAYTNTIVINAKVSTIKKLLTCDAVLFADDVKQAREELLLGFVDYAANGISLLQSKFPQYNGAGFSVSVKENKYDTADIDFKGRLLPSTVASNIISNHASSMATIIAGGGNTWNYTKGAAWNAKLSSASFANLLPEKNSYYQQSNITLQNHSYGTIVEHFYGAEAAAYDASVVTQPNLLHIFSVGNSGTVTPSTGTYTGIAGFANITGNFKQAKNILTVGHIDSFYNVLAPSSRGPSFDGRIKPELVAFGEDGSSGAAALVSGIVLTLQHAHQQLYGSIPSAALIKAILLNSADDVGASGIDFASGFGNANGFKAMQNILNGRYVNSSIASNATQIFSINIPSGVQQLKLTLAWTDPAAAPNATKALIHDLDIELEQNSNAQVWQPWVLSSSPHIDSLKKIPVRKKDTLNTVEQITVSNPQQGAYTIRVKSGILSFLQNFSVAWQIDSVETFQWYYPSENDHLMPPDSNVLRWQTTYNGTGELQLSTDAGNSWQLIDARVNLSKGWMKYAPPSVYKKALLRMKTGAVFHTSDTFSISNRLNTSVGFNCTDSVMIYWDKLPGITQYRVLRMGNQYLEPLTITTDTFITISKQNNPVLHYAVEPVLQNKALVRSYTFDYNQQGAGCYIRNFLTDLSNSNSGLLQLQLSAIVRVKSIFFEKKKATGFQMIHTLPGSASLSYTFTDVQLNTGNNIYRAGVELTDGRKFYSDESNLLFNGNEKAILFPNPVQQSQPLYVLSKPEDELTIQLITTSGSVILEQKLNDVPELINTQLLPKGIYYYRVLNKGKQKIKSGSFIIF